MEQYGAGGSMHCESGNKAKLVAPVCTKVMSKPLHLVENTTCSSFIMP